MRKDWPGSSMRVVYGLDEAQLQGFYERFGFCTDAGGVRLMRRAGARWVIAVRTRSILAPGFA